MQICILREGDELDVTHRHVIICGAGRGCLNLMNEMELPGVTHVIDSSPNKAGKTIELCGRNYCIQPFDYLASLDFNEHYLVVSSQRNAEEILTELRSLFDISNLPVCVNRRHITYYYSSWEEMVSHDPLLKRSLRLGGWAYDSTMVHESFRALYERAHGNKALESFFTLRGGENSVSFGYVVDSKKYIFRMPYDKEHATPVYAAPEQWGTADRIAWLLRHHVGTELLVCAGDDGARIDHYATPFFEIRFDDREVIENVLKSIRRFHEMNLVVPVVYDYLEERYRYFSQILEHCLEFEHEAKLAIDACEEKVASKLALLPATLRPCHGDCAYTNFVYYQGTYCLIDLDTVAMGDPLCDVCYFLFSLQVRNVRVGLLSYWEARNSLYDNLYSHLVQYGGNEFAGRHSARAALVTLSLEIIQLLFDSIANGRVDRGRLQIIVDAVDAL